MIKIAFIVGGVGLAVATGLYLYRTEVENVLKRILHPASY